MKEEEYFEFTPLGCAKAFGYLKMQEVYIPPNIGGYEMVAWANEVLKAEISQKEHEKLTTSIK